MDFEVANYMLSKENVDSELPIQNVCLFFNAAHICLMNGFDSSPHMPAHILPYLNQIIGWMDGTW
mgnify:CR=1 FL=1